MGRTRHRSTRRAWAAVLAAGAVAAGLLTGPAATARPFPEPPPDAEAMKTTMSRALPAPPGSANVRVLAFYGSAAGGVLSPVVARAHPATPKRGPNPPAPPPEKVTPP
ncbi:ThuA domain-containing protein, partial [Streptomyces lasiicapitis]